jgi:hypothetical protein
MPHFSSLLTLHLPPSWPVNRPHHPEPAMVPKTQLIPVRNSFGARSRHTQALQRDVCLCCWTRAQGGHGGICLGAQGTLVHPHVDSIVDESTQSLPKLLYMRRKNSESTSNSLTKPGARGDVPLLMHHLIVYSHSHSLYALSPILCGCFLSNSLKSNVSREAH